MMEIKICPNCNSAISQKASHCPKCGFDFSEPVEDYSVFDEYSEPAEDYSVPDEYSEPLEENSVPVECSEPLEENSVPDECSEPLENSSVSDEYSENNINDNGTDVNRNQDAMIRCRQCGEYYKREYQYCLYCGNPSSESDRYETGSDEVKTHNANIYNDNISKNDQRYSKSVEKCSNCGVPLAEGQAFCPKCGTPRVKKRICSKCGVELAEGQEFCSKCGQKVGIAVNENVTSAINQINVGVEKQKQKKKEITVIIAVALVIIILAAVAGTKIVPILTRTTADYIEMGDLEKAWSKADSDEDKQLVIDAYCAAGDYAEAFSKAPVEEKNEIIARNAVAYLSQQTSDSMKVPSSFSLNNAYFCLSYNEEDNRIYQQALLYVSGNNSYGNSVGNYWIWTANEDGEFNLIGTCSSISEDPDSDDYYISLYAKVLVKNDDTIQLDKKSVKDINALFEADKLDSVKLISVDYMDTSLMPKDGEE